MFYTYVLYSNNFDKIYIGFTSDINSRLESHNHPANKGWTKSFKPWIIIYVEEHVLKSDAMQHERELKSAKGRMFIRSLIK